MLEVLILAGRMSSESPSEREVVKQKEERRSLLALLCCAAGSEETAVQTAEMTGREEGTSYETGSHTDLYMEPHLAAGLRSLLCAWVAILCAWLCQGLLQLTRQHVVEEAGQVAVHLLLGAATRQRNPWLDYEEADDASWRTEVEGMQL